MTWICLATRFASDSNDGDPVAKVNDSNTFTDVYNRWTNWGRNAEDGWYLFGILVS